MTATEAHRQANPGRFPRSAGRARERREYSSQRWATVALCATLMLYFLPDEILLKLSVGEVKPMFWTLALFAGTMLPDYARLCKTRPYLCFLGVLCVQCVGIGIAQAAAVRFRPKYCFADVLFFWCFVSGLVYGMVSPPGTLRRVANVVVAAGGLLFAANLLLLRFNMVSVPENQPGFFTWAMFRIVMTGIIFFPLTLVDDTASSTVTAWLWPWSVIAACTASLLALTDKRSVVLYVLAVLVMLLTAANKLKGLQSRRARSAIGAALLTAGCGLAIWRYSGVETILPRFQSTDLSQEQRTEELRMMFAEVGDRIVLGSGFGSLFRSPVPYRGLLGSESDFLALTPHIGIVTPLLKGGVFGFMLLVGVPVTLLIRRSFSSTRRSLRIWSGRCMVAFFLLVASTSGGWEPGILLGLGLATSLLIFHEGRRHSPRVREMAGGRNAVTACV